MDFKIFIATFGAIFLAELADKTQVVGIGLSARSGRPLAVWSGSVCAYVIVTGISVFVGAFFGKHLKPEIVRYVSAAVFIGIGILMLYKKL